MRRWSQLAPHPPLSQPNAPVADRVCVPVRVADFDCVAVRVAALVCVPVPVAARVCEVLTVGAFERVAGLVGTGLPVDMLDPVFVGDTAVHTPHVTPGNPGAPGVALVGTYPGAHVPLHTTPHAV